MFKLDQRLAEDTFEITDWHLCKVLLMNDARYPWIILVPRRANMRELHGLTLEDQSQALEEIIKASRALEALTGCEKINIGALGNLVPQLHIHVIARNQGDEAWPGPVWGVGERLEYKEDEAADFAKRLLTALKELD